MHSHTLHLLHIAFGGDKALKIFQQIMAASVAGRDVIYFTFGEKYKGVPLHDLIAHSLDIAKKHNVTVGKRECCCGGGGVVEKKERFLFVELTSPR